ncbi:glucosaminidase domain-containing protein [Fangia hongkongensis]|uniref:glucosaminidase domain-containing protein n=1 Tax=Fangia hongkongensis TaxID=270495 RepID=UPI00036F440B|nr:glucosaminidase domain-containing protein [Fangia hongkongensis]MBK2123819.1 glucosaminidase domain-containing protein [Fangia hongkongensis]
MKVYKTMTCKKLLTMAFLCLTALFLISCSQSPEKPDFKSITNIKERKQAFINFMLPLIHQAQAKVLNERQVLLNINAKVIQGNKLSKSQLTALEGFAKSYKVPFNPSYPNYAIFPLLMRVNVIPTSMVLAQAALESGWGTSRFAVQGNNYFGQHCFSKGCGMVPKDRAKGAINEVAVFETPLASVDAYFKLLNTGDKFKAFRRMRADLLAKGNPLTGKDLISTLVHYSELKDGEYEKRLLVTMDYNDLYKYN